jgi:FlaA1/EpsC-like NDP-sugar epimerase
MMKPWVLDFRRPLVTVCHFILFGLSIALAFLLRFEFSVPDAVAPILRTALWISAGLKSCVILAFGLDRGWWRFVSIADAGKVLGANCAASAAFVLVTYAVFGKAFPRSVYVIDFLLSFLLTAGLRFAVRLYNESFVHDLSKGNRKGILIYGAGAAGATLAREIKNDRSLGYHVLGFLDDDPNKVGLSIIGIPVLTTGKEVSAVVERFKRKSPPVEEIVIAMPSATNREMREAIAHCRASGIPCKTVPGIGELLSGRILAEQIRKPSLNDLLGREPVRLETERIRSVIEGGTVMVTGGAGSIGSELCRQIAIFQPSRLILFDQAESDLYRIDRELREHWPALDVRPEIGDICDDRRVEGVIRRHSVDTIFHAAAYKHVPMMELNVHEAVKNNILGTWNIVRTAARHSVSRLVLISTDKAVNPTSVMGLTKRVSELIVSAVAAASEKKRVLNYSAVRFGNVLGSNGSVIPLFEAQIAAGGPVTVTHPEVRRYFMTIREAAQLVLQASAMSRGAEIFLLDMGEPIRIADLARNMIRLSGLEPDEDIEIRYIGLRSGEKLWEELTMEGENILPTAHTKINVFDSVQVGIETIQQWLRELEKIISTNDDSRLFNHLQRLVPEYRPATFLTPPARARAQEVGL